MPPEHIERMPLRRIGWWHALAHEHYKKRSGGGDDDVDLFEELTG